MSTLLSEEDLKQQHFNKIALVSNMALDIASYGEAQGIPQLVERLDMTCGAIPQGDYETVIDQASSYQFLELYTHVAEHRFAFAVTELLKLNPAYIKALINYCFDKGKNFKIGQAVPSDAAYEIINYWILDGMPGDNKKKIIQKSSDTVQWQNSSDTHIEFWNKVSGDVNVYYQLQYYFVQGILEGSGVKFLNKDNNIFTLTTL